MRVFLVILISLSFFACSCSIAQEQNEAKEETLNLNPTAPETPVEKAPVTEGEAASKDSAAENASSTAPALETTIDLPVPERELHETDIKKYLSSDIVSPMLAGTEDFITLTQTDLHATDKGIMILLPEWNQLATSPKAINFLRKYLPTQGWTTIALQPIDKPSLYPSQVEKKVEQREANTKALTDYKNQLMPMMKAVFDKAAGFPGIFVVVSEGNNAAILLDLFEQQQLPEPNAFVMLSAHQLTREDNIAFANNLAMSELPVLDLYLNKDNTWVHHFIKLRQQYAKKELKTYYRQQEFNTFNPGYYPEQELARAIKGWLSSIGW